MFQQVYVLWILFIVLATQVAMANVCRPFPLNGTHPGVRHRVKAYRVNFEQCIFEGQNVYVIREFRLNGVKAKLLVNGSDASSEIIKSSCLKLCKKRSWQEFTKTFYGNLLEHSSAPPYRLRNDGITYGRGRKVSLTIDMCPSSRGFSKSVYRALEKRAKSEKRVIPVGVAMTRSWMQRWPQHFLKLKNYQARNVLAIEWINHSANHRYYRGVPFRNNFLLNSKTNLQDEILGNEIALIRAGVTPGVFFRFPGLVSNKRTMNYVTRKGLVVLGSQAWLAKSQRPQLGSIVLIHGNKNEPIGESLLLKYMKTMRVRGHEFGRLDEVL